MFKIALVQNASELRNYSFVDDTKLIKETIGFECINFTSCNIHDLDNYLIGQNAVSCVLFATNSLNDPKLMNMFVLMNLLICSKDI